MAESTMSAIAKLRAAGVEPDTSQLASLEPSVQASEPAFEPLWNAVLERARVSFTYRDGSTRTFEPWGMTSFKGRWYVVGRDVDRDASRMFRLSRFADLPRRISRPGAYEVPTDLDLRRLARSLVPPEATETAVLAIRSGAAPVLSRRTEPAQTDRTLPAGFDVVAVGYGELYHLAEEIAQYGADVLVLEPPELREVVLRGLTAVVDAGLRGAA
jgi:proteasome accessory factor B